LFRNKLTGEQGLYYRKEGATEIVYTHTPSKKTKKRVIKI
jgi:hypothetical protein